MDADNMAALEAELATDEGEKLYAYQDSRGYWTIGIGTLIDKRGGGITHEEALLLLRNRLAAKEADLDEHLPWWRNLSPARQRVLLNMCYNMGIGDAATGKGLLGFRNTIAAIREGRYEDAAEGMERSLWATQVGDRAARLAALMRQG